jgi:two-component system chemotaxis response regulator CheB
MPQSVSGSISADSVNAAAASAGGIRAIRTLLAALPSDLPAALVVVQHRPPGHEGYLHEVLRGRSGFRVVSAAEGEPLTAGTVYVARSDSHLPVAGDRSFPYHDGTRIRHLRSSANPLFESAAKVFDGPVIAVVLSGGGKNATDGVRGVKAHGGLVIVQDQATSQHWHMPRSAIVSGAVDYVLPLDGIGPVILDIVHDRPITSATGSPS